MKITKTAWFRELYERVVESGKRAWIRERAEARQCPRCGEWKSTDWDLCILCLEGEEYARIERELRAEALKK